MSNSQLSLLQNEWLTLQTQFDSYEKCSLAIKLFNVLLASLSLFVLHANIWALIICAVVWLQDGIWKTFQSRIAQRLEVVESAIKHCSTEHSSEDSSKQNVDSSHLPMQFNSTWEESRPGAVGLVAEYIKNSIKPTVAFPHVILIALIIAQAYVF
jgi:hypothetical protein